MIAPLPSAMWVGAARPTSRLPTRVYPVPSVLLFPVHRFHPALRPRCALAASPWSLQSVSLRAPGFWLLAPVFIHVHLHSSVVPLRSPACPSQFFLLSCLPYFFSDPI